MKSIKASTSIRGNTVCQFKIYSQSIKTAPTTSKYKDPNRKARRGTLHDSHDLRNKSRPIECQASERITTLHFPKDLTVEVESTMILKHQDENLRYCNGGHILHAPTNRKFEADILMIHNFLTLMISREEYSI